MAANDRCLFCRIISGEIPSKKVFEDDVAIAFNDINPQAPTHVLVIPRTHISTLDDLDDHDALIPASVAECFDFAGEALDLAEMFQTPIFVLSDLDLGMNNHM